MATYSDTSLRSSPYSWFKGLGFQLLIVFLIILFQYALYAFFQMPLKESYYSNSFLVLRVKEFGLKYILAFVLLFTGAVYLEFSSSKPREHVVGLSRYIYIAVVVIQTYTIAVMDYNHYFDQWYMIDRIILVLLSILAIWRPVLLPFYILQLVLLTSQLEFPNIIGYDSTHKSLVIPLLLCFWLFASSKKVLTYRLPSYVYTIIVISIICTWYLQAGMAKFELNWQNDNDLYYLLAASHDAGWLYTIPTESLIALGELVTKNHIVIQYLGLIIELILPLVIFLNRRIAIVCFFAFICFHGLVFALSGIFFWQWMVIEGIIIYVLVSNSAFAKQFFQLKNAVTYYFLLLLIPTFVYVIKLAWLDCGYLNAYTFFVKNAEGETKKLDTSFFAPYDVGFAKNRFTYTLDGNFISNTLGQCRDAEVINIIKAWQSEGNEKSTAQIIDYRDQKGRKYFNVDKAQRFNYFLKEFTTNKLRYDPKFISNVDVPLHMAQGENQQNISFDNATELMVLYQEKAILPNFEEYIVSSDTLRIKL
ncbi:hypothetical protein GCM10009117_03950 [Gangjinia marincola]|uniref:HTTM domain-containing protein n=1 Tax=Gangjinia marincola TaxID=578463 RepID=A0ABP3XPR7_9FLAO